MKHHTKRLKQKKNQTRLGHVTQSAAKLALLCFSAAALVACGGGDGSAPQQNNALVDKPVIRSVSVSRLPAGQWAWALVGQNLPDDLKLELGRDGVCSDVPIYRRSLSDAGATGSFTCSPGPGAVADFSYSFTSKKASNLDASAISGKWIAATADMSASNINPTVGQSIQIWISNTWANIKQVVWSFSGSVANVASNVVNGVSEKINQTFTTPGNKTITATYIDANGNTLGTGKLVVTVAVGTVTTTATITAVQNDNVSPVTAIPNNTSTTDTTPKITGTISAALGAADAVRVYAGTTLLGMATTKGTNWVLTGGAALASAAHTLKAVVYNAYSMTEGSNTNTWTITVTGGTTATSKLPHTGITANQCYSAGSNTLMACSGVANDLNAQQDGHRGSINAMSYSKVGFSGEALADNASSWCAVKDKVTGLMWQNHQSTPSTYTNFGDNSDGDASKYASDNATLCGHSGWRLPTVDELQSIVDYSVYGPSINTTWFPNAPSNGYWSSSPNVGNSYLAWFVFFYDGYVGNSTRYDRHLVRLVRASQ